MLCPTISYTPLFVSIAKLVYIQFPLTWQETDAKGAKLDLLVGIEPAILTQSSNQMSYIIYEYEHQPLISKFNRFINFRKSSKHVEAILNSFIHLFRVSCCILSFNCVPRSWIVQSFGWNWISTGGNLNLPCMLFYKLVPRTCICVVENFDWSTERYITWKFNLILQSKIET
jgi:hypothetical protein